MLARSMMSWFWPAAAVVSKPLIMSRPKFCTKAKTSGLPVVPVSVSAAVLARIKDPVEAVLVPPLVATTAKFWTERVLTVAEVMLQVPSADAVVVTLPSVRPVAAAVSVRLTVDRGSAVPLNMTAPVAVRAADCSVGAVAATIVSAGPAEIAAVALPAWSMATAEKAWVPVASLPAVKLNAVPFRVAAPRSTVLPPVVS